MSGADNMVKGGFLAFLGFGIGIISVIYGLSSGHLVVAFIGGLAGFVIWLYGVSRWMMRR